jgi:hypothetical protein
MADKKIDLTVNFENIIPYQLDISKNEKEFAQKYCEEFIVKNVDINEVEVEYILLSPDNLLNFITSITRNYDRFKEENK